jgi:hypothetical protein
MNTSFMLKRLLMCSALLGVFGASAAQQSSKSCGCPLVSHTKTYGIGVTQAVCAAIAGSQTAALTRTLIDGTGSRNDLLLTGTCALANWTIALLPTCGKLRSLLHKKSPSTKVLHPLDIALYASLSGAVKATGLYAFIGQKLAADCAWLSSTIRAGYAKLRRCFCRA